LTLDPYRTLGLDQSASSAEVKRAYRRLAKAFHPDSAGEAALPRFLAIHEAYEAIRTGRPMGATRAGPPPAEPAAGAPASEPWRADPARARAARERARTGRGGRTGAAGAKSRTSGASGTSGTSGSRGGRRGGTRKATLGSTSYDEARDPADATWSGASWYGPSSGEYWIINPREYADPRKHGPEYQSRARRMAAEASVSGTIEDDAPFAAAPFVATPVGEADFDADLNSQAFETRAAAADPSRGRTRAGRAAHAARAAHTQPARPARPVRPTPSTGDTTVAWDGARIRAARSDWHRPSGEPDRDWLNGATDDPVRRFGIALVAWPPMGLAAAAAIGEVTGCSAYAATCSGTDSLLPWLAQAGILGLLLLLPALARLLAGGTVAVLLALVPVTAFLLVVGGAGEPEAGFALAFLLGVAWTLGVAGSVVAARRRGVPNRAGGAP
jgi:DnaJ domain